MKAILVTLSLLLPAVASADTQGKVHSEPAAVCPDFKAHHLCFDVPHDGVARAEYFSEPFYAIILETMQRCSFSEKKRLEVQALFPLSKVFAESFNCDDDPEEFIRYTNVNAKFGFLAVHAGGTLKQARNRLAEVKATGKYPGANIRKMQAVIVFP